MDGTEDKNQKIHISNVLIIIGLVIIFFVMVYGIIKSWDVIIAGLIGFFMQDVNVMVIFVYIGMILVLAGIFLYTQRTTE